MVLSVILKGKAENMEKREWRYSGTIEERTSIREQVHDVLARKVAEEAMVLLKNESLLPLPLDVPMALFGSGAKKTVKGGIGSGDVNNRKTISVYQGLLEAGAMIRIFEGEELEPFRGDERFGEAFLFHELPKDEIGVGAYRDGVLLGMAGATSDSDSMWQIGINVMPEAEGLGIGSMLVAVLKNEILKRGKLPFYGTSMSHIASQRVALGAGFVPMWAELYCKSCK